MVVGHRTEVAGRPAIHEGVGVDTGHPVLGHLGQFPIGEPGQLGEEERIEIRVLRRATAVGVEEWERLVEIMHDRRVGGEVPLGDRMHLYQGQIDVPVVVVVGVAAPVRNGGNVAVRGRRRRGGRLGGVATRGAGLGSVSAGGGLAAVTARCDRLSAVATGGGRLGRVAWGRGRLGRVGQAELQIPVKPVDVPVPAVGVRGRRDRDVEIVPDLRYDRRGLCRQPVDQLHQHLRRAGLAAVEAAHQVIVWFGRPDQRRDFGFTSPARIGNLGKIGPISRHRLHVRFGGDPDHHQLAALVGAPDRLDLDARGRGGQRPIVAELVGIVGELPGRADVIAEYVLRGRDPVDQRQVVHQRTPEPEIGEPFPVALHEGRVLLLAGVAGVDAGLLRCERTSDERSGADEREHHCPASRRDRSEGHCEDSSRVICGNG